MFNNININSVKKLERKIHEIRVDFKSKKKTRNLEEVFDFLCVSLEKDMINFSFIALEGNTLYFIIYTTIINLDDLEFFYTEIRKAKSFCAKNVTEEILIGRYSKDFFWDVIREKTKDVMNSESKIEL
jgi:hypothetical protein